MEFYDLLDQVLELLRSRGRVSYRALKRQYGLDDALIEDLKDEILYSQPQVAEDGDRGLVWTAEAEVEPESASALPSTEPAGPDAERRQLTVMFCDLVGSTVLSGQLDPEDLREVVRSYQETCSEIIRHHDGHIAQLLGDGLLVYFGYPRAHEDDAHRAVRAGLGILNVMEALNTRLEREQNVRLAVRMGIHTGLVVVGQMGNEDRPEQLALGKVPNITARIQGLAEPNSIVISAATHRLVQGYFTSTELGPRTLRGVADPVVVYDVSSESGVQSRLDLAGARGLTPLVGRESEVSLLRERWDLATGGDGQVVLLSGEAGIGKSRMVAVLKEHVADTPHTRLESRSSTYYQNTALYPLIDLFERAADFQRDDSSDVKLDKLEEFLRGYRLPLKETVPLFPPLLSVPLPEERYRPLALSPQRQRQQTLEVILGLVLELAEEKPVLFIVEDTHWLDPSTLVLLDLLVDQAPTSRVLVILTHRPEFESTWGNRAYLTQITLHRLSSSQIPEMVERITHGRALPPEVLQQLVDKTDGVPLYVEESTEMVLESGHLNEVDGHYELIGSLPALAVPSTIQDSLMARLERLISAKGIAQLGATIGRRFTYELLEAVSQLDDATLQRELTRLVETELLYQRGLPPNATYTFKHALIQDTAYQSLLKSTRQENHRRIAQVLTERFPETAPELLAHHYTEAALTEQALVHWHGAGERAVARSAHVEAIGHLRKGLGMLQDLQDGPKRAEHQLNLLIALGPPLIATKGYGATEVEEVYTQARELCREVGEKAQICPILYGLWTCYNTWAEYETARTLGEELLVAAERVQDPAYVLDAYVALSCTSFFLGEFDLALEHGKRGMTLYDPQRHRSHALQNPGLGYGAINAVTLWYLGYPEQALAMCHETLSLARELAHPFSLVVVLTWFAMLHQLRRDPQQAQALSEEAMAISSEQRKNVGRSANGSGENRGTFPRGGILSPEGRAAPRPLGRRSDWGGTLFSAGSRHCSPPGG